MSLRKNLYTPGQWYPFFFVPPKPREMSLYYLLAEREISRLYSFLPKDQVRGKLLDFLGVPNTGGKINKAKLHEIFLFETSAKGKKKLLKMRSRFQELKNNPLKPANPYQGPFKFFKSKNLRSAEPLSSVVGKSKELQEAPVGEASHGDADSDVQFVPSDLKIKAGSSKLRSKDFKGPEKAIDGPHQRLKTKDSRKTRGNVLESSASAASGETAKRTGPKETPAPTLMNFESRDKTATEDFPSGSKIDKGVPRKSEKSALKEPGAKSIPKIARPCETPDSFWYENTVSPESDKSYSVESEDDGAKFSSRNEKRLFSKKSLKATSGSEKTTPRKATNILKRDEFDNNQPVIIPVEAENPPESSKLDTDAPETFDIGVDLHDESSSGPPNDRSPKIQPTKAQISSSALTMPENQSQKTAMEPEKSNPDRKTVEFKNVEYFFYTKDSSSSLTQRSGSSHRSGKSITEEFMNDSSSDDNEYDTGFVSPMVMSQESNWIEQDTMAGNTLREIKSSPWALGSFRPKFPQFSSSSPQRFAPECQTRVEELPKDSSSAEQNTALALQNAQHPKSPISSQELAVVPHLTSNLGMVSPDLEVVRRFGSLRPEEENLSQISTGTEIFSARVMVDLRNPEALEMIQQHYRTVMEAVNSQTNVQIPRAVSTSIQRPMLTPPSQNEDSQVVDDHIIHSQHTRENMSISEPLETPPSAEPLQANAESHETRYPVSPERTAPIFQQSNLSYRDTNVMDENVESVSVTETAEFSRVEVEAAGSVADDRSSIVSQPTGISQLKRIPFKKRHPLLAAPKLNFITFNQPGLAARDTTSSTKSPAPRSPSAACGKTSVTDICYIKRPPLGSIEASAHGQEEKSSAFATTESPSAATFKTNTAVSCCRTTSSRDSAKARTHPDKITQNAPSAKRPIGVIAESPAIPSDNTSSVGIVKRPSVDSIEASHPVNLAAPATGSHGGSIRNASSDTLAVEVTDPSSSAAIESIQPLMAVEGRSPKGQQAPVSSLKGAAVPSAAAVKTASSINSAAATKESSSGGTKAKADGKPQHSHSATAEKLDPGSRMTRTEGFQPHRANISSKASHSSRGSLKEWQRQANLAWKMSLPHITHQFFNDPDMVAAFSDDVASRSGITWSEPSSRVKLLDDVEAEPELPEETHDRDTNEMSGSPATLNARAGSPRDYNPHEPACSNSVDLDAETQLKSASEPIDDPLFDLNSYSRDLDSFLSLASRSTAEKALSEGSRQAPAVTAQAGPPLPVWWQREFTTPKQKSFLEEDSRSSDSMHVILPRSQVLREHGTKTPAIEDPFPPSYDLPEAQEVPTGRLEAEEPLTERPEASSDCRSGAWRRTSVVRSRPMTKPPSADDQPAEHDFFLEFVKTLWPPL